MLLMQQQSVNCAYFYEIYIAPLTNARTINNCHLLIITQAWQNGRINTSTATKIQPSRVHTLDWDWRPQITSARILPESPKRTADRNARARARTSRHRRRRRRSPFRFNRNTHSIFMCVGPTLVRSFTALNSRA